MRTLLFFMLITILGSCVTSEKCSERFPSESKEIVTTVFKTDTILLADTWFDTVFVEVQSPSHIDTVFLTDTVEIPGRTVYRSLVCLDTVFVCEDSTRVTELETLLLSARDSLLKVNEVLVLERERVTSAKKLAARCKGLLCFVAAVSAVLMMILGSQIKNKN